MIYRIIKSYGGAIMQYNNTYSPLTDAEWEQVKELTGVPTHPPGQGRPRVSQRSTFNGILHGITTGQRLTAVASSQVDYPSPPTLRRFYELMIDNHVLPAIGMALEHSRPGISWQISMYTRGAKKKPLNNAPTPLSWGINLSPLPWNSPPKQAASSDAD